MNQEIAGVYLSKVTISDFHCFKGENEINFTRPDGRYQQWNVILGNNNTGKTTILRLLSGLDAIKFTFEGNHNYLFAPIAASIGEGQVSYFTNNSSFSVDAEILRTKGTNIRWYNEGINSIKSYLISSQIEAHENNQDIQNLKFYGYGTSRKIKASNLSETLQEIYFEGLFDDTYELANTEEWLLQLDYAAKSGVANAAAILEKLKTVLTSGLLPDVKSIELKSELDEKTNSVKNYALFDTDYGKVRLKELGDGYQSTMAWVVDLAKKLFERYPQLDNPLTGPAIVLVDEIDLHLHPDWQRKIIKHLSGIFPNTQFIVTAHSPLVVQSAEDINLIILEKGENGQTHIRQEFGTYQGWTIEEILQDLMGLGEKTLSDKYLHFLSEFDAGLDSDDYPRAKAAYEELIRLLHPTSSQRKLLKLQLGAIAPATV
ncbi:MAG TPA: hypothetical protein DCM71_19105 [Runella sp.]|nr:hypothetical protein [Runella sp.]